MTIELGFESNSYLMSLNDNIFITIFGQPKVLGLLDQKETK